MVSAFAGVVVMYVVADAHNLLLRPTDFVVAPGSEVHVRVLNGTFTTSESPVTRERLRDLTIVGAHGSVHPNTITWTAVGKESSWHVRVDEARTYLLGASVHPKTIRLKGADFNKYLREAGLPDVLAARRTSGVLDKPAHERYSKHVKSLIRVESSSRRTKRAPGDTAFARVLATPPSLSRSRIPMISSLVQRSTCGRSSMARRFRDKLFSPADGRPKERSYRSEPCARTTAESRVWR